MQAAGDAIIVEQVARSGGRTFFVTVGRGEGELPFDAQEYKAPDMTADDKRRQMAALEAQMEQARGVMARAYASREAIEAHGERLREQLDFSRAGNSGRREAEDRLHSGGMGHGSDLRSGG